MATTTTDGTTYVQSPSAPSTISANALNEQNKISTVPAPQTNPQDLQNIISSVPGLSQTENQLNTLNRSQQVGATNLSNLQNILSGKSQEQANIEQQAGIAPMQTDIQNLTGQLNAIQTANTTIPLQTQQEYTGRLATQAGTQAIDTGRLRENAIQALTIGAQLQAKQGNLALAQNQVDRAINLKYDTIAQQIEAQQNQLKLNQDYFVTPLEKKRAEEMSFALDKQKQALEDTKAKDLAINKMIVEASPNAPADIISKAKSIADNGGSQIEVAQALGQYGGDYLVREKLKTEIKSMNAKAKTTGGNVSGVLSTASSTAKDWLSQFNSGLMSIEDIYTKIGSSKEAMPLKNEVAKLIAAQGGKRIYGKDDASIQAINAQIKNVDDLLTGDVGSIVGVVQGGLGVLPDKWNVYKQDALSVAKNLISNQTLQSLADAKSKGITFGALSEGELGLVADSASRIASKIIKDKDGNITGFSGSEGQFKEDLQTVKDGLQKSLGSKTGDSESGKVADDILKANNNVQSQIKNAGYNVFNQ